MVLENHIQTLELPSLSWPAGLDIPVKHFRLFVAADATHFTSEGLAKFARCALKQGMVYFCAWGPGCETFHDAATRVVGEDECGERLFVGPKPNDVIMTTSHERETLEEALEYFLIAAHPTDGFAPESDYWIAMSVDNPLWLKIIRAYIERMQSNRTQKR